MEDMTNSPLPQLPTRRADSHKGDYGRLLMIGGSRGMPGAIALAGIAALRSGAGLVTLAVPRAVQPVVAGFEPSYMTYPVGSVDTDHLGHDALGLLLELADEATAVALGPGLGRAPETMRLVGALYHRIKQPMVVDADALNALAANPERLQSPGGPRILTPHPGEFHRLTGEPVAATPAERAEQAARLCRHGSRDASDDVSSDASKACGTVVVLKGHRTVICDGRQYAVNTTGNPGMSTGGTGDCLTGIITALVGQGQHPWQAARLGAHLHGQAGDLAAQELGQVSLVASDLPKYLPAAIRACADVGDGV